MGSSPSVSEMKIEVKQQQQQQPIKEEDFIKIIENNERKTLTDILDKTDTFEDLKNAKFSAGSTPLHLIAKMADKIKPDIINNHPLYEASHSSSAMAFEILRRHGGVDVNAKDDLGRTALHYVCESGSGKQWCLIELLLEFGAKINISDRDGNIPLHLVAKTKNLQSFALILTECLKEKVSKRGRGSEASGSKIVSVFDIRNAKGQTFYQLLKDPLMLKLFKRFYEISNVKNYNNLPLHNIKSGKEDFDKLIQEISSNRSIYRGYLMNVFISLLIINDYVSVQKLSSSSSLNNDKNKTVTRGKKLLVQEYEKTDNYPSKLLPSRRMETVLSRFIKFKEIPGRMIYFKCKNATGKINWDSSYEYETCRDFLISAILAKNLKLERAILENIKNNTLDNKNNNNINDKGILNYACEMGNWNIISSLIDNNYEFDAATATSLLQRYHPNLVEQFKQKQEKPITCPICREDFKPERTKANLNLYLPAISWTTLQPCNHTYHSDCLKLWLSSHQRCPLCRGQILETKEVTRVS